MLPAQPLVLRVMDGLALATAVYHRLAATALLELDLSGRLVQLVELAAGVGASYELPGQLHVHSVVQSQRKLRHSQALIEAILDKEVDIWTLTYRSGIGVLQTQMHADPCLEIVF